MTRVTAESIRVRMKELQKQMALLEKFNASGFADSICPYEHHNWKITDYRRGSRRGEWSTPDDLEWFATFECSVCGVTTWRCYTVQGHDDSVEDPWAALRPEQEEE